VQGKPGIKKYGSIQIRNSKLYVKSRIDAGALLPPVWGTASMQARKHQASSMTLAALLHSGYVGLKSGFNTGISCCFIKSHCCSWWCSYHPALPLSSASSDSFHGISSSIPIPRCVLSPFPLFTLVLSGLVFPFKLMFPIPTVSPLLLPPRRL